MTWDEPNVCGVSPRSEITAESVCKNCERPIYRTRFYTHRWRHPDGFILCLALYRGRDEPKYTAEPVADTPTNG